ncbi:lanthionine synthetase C family protein [Kitasatospora sp. NPDC059747]|uniref:lanthionine synthetase C family protein n=1 Tax=Kitasatospora sp. NPDC059747 TaxID=3346930 RepID=UPI0036561837
MHTDRRDAANATVLQVLELLRSWERAATGTSVSGTFAPGSIDERIWSPLSLANGFTGVSLLFSEYAAVDRSYLPVAHAYFEQAKRYVTKQDLNHPGLYHGIGSLALAVNSAHRAVGGYRSALDSLDSAMRAGSGTILSGVTPGISSTFRTFDVISGLSGVGRYFLGRPSTENVESLRAILDYLVALTGTTWADGTELPRWWVQHHPRAFTPDPKPRDGHGNFGLAHGISGPLTLLAAAHQAGITVARQEEAIRSYSDTLLSWARRDEFGVFWPHIATFEEFTGGNPVRHAHRGRPSWCYGEPGVSYALMLAGTTLGIEEYRAAARESVQGLLAAPLDDLGLSDSGICHGWAGLMHLLRKFEGLGIPQLSDAVDSLAGRIISQFDPSHPFGFQFSVLDPKVKVNSPGFLDGAAGVALALHSYARNDIPASAWETALLLA